jgi:hypothetical protein
MTVLLVLIAAFAIYVEIAEAVEVKNYTLAAILMCIPICAAIYFTMF